MLALLNAAERLAERIQDAASTTVESRNNGWVEQEPQFTDRLLGRIEDAVNKFDRAGDVQWRARTLTDRGPSAEEHRFGADFLGVFEATSSGLSIAKGFLSQAKNLEEGSKLKSAELARLRQQCRSMLRLTPDAYVFLYGRKGVRVVSAVAVLGSGEQRLDELGPKSIKVFFYDHFRCFIGDPSLTSPAHLSLLRLFDHFQVDIVEVPRLLLIEAVGP
jgi:hypothetical protein